MDDIEFMDIESAAKQVWPDAIVREIKTPADLERLYQDGQAIEQRKKEAINQ